MRLLFPVAIVLAAAAPAVPAKTPPLQRADTDCPGVTNQWVREGRSWRSEPVKPRKLGELPPAEAYAAVYRLDERGCMVPVKFREVRP
jgi:hypothetical protein